MANYVHPAILVRCGTLPVLLQTSGGLFCLHILFWGTRILPGTEGSLNKELAQLQTQVKFASHACGFLSVLSNFLLLAAFVPLT